MKTEITDFGRQRRNLLTFTVSSLIAASCGSTPTATPVKETLLRIAPGQTKATSELTIENEVGNSVVIDPARFRFTVRECFIDQPQLLTRIRPDDITITLQPESAFNQPEPPFNQVKMNGKNDVWLAVGSCVEHFKTEPSLDPYGTNTSEMLSYLFVEGVFCWARRRDICKEDEWKDVNNSFFRTSQLLKGSVNFAGFLQLGPTA